MRKLIDVSSYNGRVDWKKAKVYGCEGAILKIVRKDLKSAGEYIIIPMLLQPQKLKVTWNWSAIF